MSEIKIERRGRPRTRDVEKWDEIERNYLREYMKQRRNNPDDAFRYMQSRTYYRRVLKNMSPEDPKFEKVSKKLDELEIKIEERQSQRVRYQKQNILNKTEVQN